MAQPLTHLYELALRILEDQERRAHEMRNRVAPVLAAGGLGATLLARPALDVAEAGGFVPRAAAAVGIFGLLGALAGAGYVLKAHTLTHELDAEKSMRMFARAGLLDDADVFYSSMIVTLAKQRTRGDEAIRRLRAAFTVMLCGILVELCGFGLSTALR